MSGEAELPHEQIIEENNETKDSANVPRPDPMEMCQAIPSVTENMQKYSKRQIAQASQARTKYQTLGSLTVENFKSILQ